MNNMGYLPKAGSQGKLTALIYVFNICLYVGNHSPVTTGSGHRSRPALRWRFSRGARALSVPGIADQGFARPEHQHQDNAQKAQHRKNRLVQHDPDETAPEPGRHAFHPGPKSVLAGLVDVVPELAEPGEAQVLIGDPARAVIDHEAKSARQQ